MKESPGTSDGVLGHCLLRYQRVLLRWWLKSAMTESSCHHSSGPPAFHQLQDLLTIWASLAELDKLQASHRCWRRLNLDSACQSNFDRGLVANS